MSYNLEEIQNGYEKLKYAFPPPEEKKDWIFDNHVVISYRRKNETEATTHKSIF